MMDKYLVITTGEEGIYVQFLTKTALCNGLDDGNYSGDTAWMDKFPEDGDPMYWGTSGIIIKGKVIVPKSQEVTIKHNVE